MVSLTINQSSHHGAPSNRHHTTAALSGVLCYAITESFNGLWTVRAVLERVLGPCSCPARAEHPAGWCVWCGATAGLPL